jgi:hypothetical protein
MPQSKIDMAAAVKERESALRAAADEGKMPLLAVVAHTPLSEEALKDESGRASVLHAGSIVEFGSTDEAYPKCTDRQNADNTAAVGMINALIPRAQGLTAAANQIGDDSTDMGILDRAVRDANLVWDFPYAQCDPTYPLLRDTYNNQFVPAINESSQAKQRAYLRIFSNFDRVVAALRPLVDELRAARQEFEQTDTGGGGVSKIDAIRERFERQVAKLRSFVLHDFKTIEGTLYKAGDYQKRANDIIAAGYHEAVITNLDRLRDEYVKAGRPVPRPEKFTQTKSSQRYTFAQLNTGDYSWALLTDNLLSKIDAIAAAIEAAGYQVQLNSVYRNPARANGLSQHQYGTAVDIQVFDFNQSGGPRDGVDWEILKGITDRFSPVYTEPISQSTAGHVHVDWRGFE